jgi:hypothetical protein
MVRQALFLNHICAWLFGVAVTPGLVLTFNPNVITQPLTSVGLEVGVWVDVPVGVGVDVSVGVGVAQHVTQDTGVEVGHSVVDTSAVGVDKAAKIVKTALLIS